MLNMQKELRVAMLFILLQIQSFFAEFSSLLNYILKQEQCLYLCLIT